MVAKFEAGRRYYIEHPNFSWAAHVKVLDVDPEGRPKVVLTKWVRGSNGFKEFLETFGEEGCRLGLIDWNLKEIHMYMENK